MPDFRKQRIAGRIIKSFLVLIVMAVNAIIIWRVFFSVRMPKEIDTIIGTDAAKAAYAEHGRDLVLLCQDQASITRAVGKNAGYFSVPECVFIPQANEVQVVFRYNNSTIKHLAEDYGLSAVPDKSEHLFDVTLVRTRDLTPETREDNADPDTLEYERFFAAPDRVVRETTSLYTYYRYVFENVSVEDVTAGVFADVYYVGDIDYNERAYGTLCLYLVEDDWLTYKLTKDDRKALE